MSKRIRGGHVLAVFVDRTDPKTGLAKVSDSELVEATGFSRRWIEACCTNLRRDGHIETAGYDETNERRRIVRVIR